MLSKRFYRTDGWRSSGQWYRPGSMHSLKVCHLIYTEKYTCNRSLPINETILLQ